ncbi:MAG: DotU family type IV/VI secretion system protein [Pseudomonadota bacterium]
MARQTAERSDDDHLVRQFRAFYDEVSKAQTRAIEMREIDPEAASQDLERHLENLIELQTLESKREGSRFELESIADARYLKAALADEMLLNSDWIGRETWTSHLLEASLFRTSVAGDRVFERIEDVLSSREPSRRDIARLYLFALALGYQGRYRGTNESGKLAGLREELFQFVYQRPAELSGRDRVLSDRPYASTLSHIAPRKLPTLSRWTVGFILSLVALLAISEMLWVWQSWPVRQVLQTGRIAAPEAAK